MTITLPAWYLYGVLASFILTLSNLIYFWIKIKRFPVRLREIPGVLFLMAIDAMCSWLTFALGFYNIWFKRKEREQVIKDLRELGV